MNTYSDFLTNNNFPCNQNSKKIGVSNYKMDTNDIKNMNRAK